MRILSVGNFSAYGGNSTACHRSYWLKTNSSYYKELDSTTKPSILTKISRFLYRLGIPINAYDESQLNIRLLEEVSETPYDIIWIDKGSVLYSHTLERIKSLQPNCVLVHYMIDDFMNPDHKTKQIIDTIPLYDYYIVNRKININELREYGCKCPIFVYMTYEGRFHYPRHLNEEDYSKYGGNVGFIGAYEKERGDSIIYLASHGIPVRVWGCGWEKLIGKYDNLRIEGRGLYGEEYCKAISAFKINLGFLRKKSRDLHTTRSVEIPACGGFLLAERTEEHQSLFDEDIEAVFFSTNEELMNKIVYYLKYEDKRNSIAFQGYKRCQNENYSNERMILSVLDHIKDNMMK